MFDLFISEANGSHIKDTIAQFTYLQATMNPSTDKYAVKIYISYEYIRMSFVIIIYLSLGSYFLR